LNSVLWIAKQGLIEGLRSGVGTALSIAYIGACSVYTFTLYPFFIEGVADLRHLFEFIPFLLILFAPTLTMHLVNMEQHQRSLDVWLVRPLTYPQLLLGKLGGAWLLFTITSIVSLLLPLLLFLFAPLHWPSIFSAYLGILLIGTMNLCIGLWASIFARSPLSAWLLSFTLCFAFYIIGLSARFLPSPFAEWSQLLSAQQHLSHLVLGIVDTRDLMYFLVMIWFWFMLAVETLRTKVNHCGHRKV
jgi:ABC-2 type transport system permease protein